jgi:hypothetical protein
MFCCGRLRKREAVPEDALKVDGKANVTFRRHTDTAD